MLFKQYNLKGARRSVYHIEYARSNNYLFIPNISENYFNRINDYMKDVNLIPYLVRLIQVLSEPLINLETCFAVDGTGFKTSDGKSRYKQIRTNLKEKREYIGLHIIAGIKYKTIPYAVVSKGYVHDNNFFKKLILKTKENFKINEIYGDGAYLNRENANFCEALNIKAYLKPKENTNVKGLIDSPWKKTLQRYYDDLELGDKRRYTLRNSVESTFMMLKSVFSDVLRHKKYRARVNEVLARVACHNIRCLIYTYFKGDIQFPFTPEAKNGQMYVLR